MLIADVITAFRHGKKLANSAAWKKGGVAASALTAFLVSVVGIARALGYQIPVSDVELEAIAGGIAVLASVFSGIVHVVTTTSIGLQPVGDDVQRP